MEQILIAYSLPKETVAAIMMLYKNTKVKVRSPDEDTDYFNIVAGVQQGNTLAPYQKSFMLTKGRIRRYSAQTTTDADYADDIALLANKSTQAESLLHSLEQTAAGICLQVNEDKMEYMCFYHSGDMYTLRWSFETGGQVRLSQKQHLLNSERHQHATRKGMDS